MAKDEKNPKPTDVSKPPLDKIDFDALANGMNAAVEEAAAPLLRDIYAACALIGTDCRGALSVDAIAERCYNMADAMLKRRAETLPAQPLPQSASRARDAS